jgi:hypothetical protein
MLNRPAIWICSVVTIAVSSCVPKAIVVVEETPPVVAAAEPEKEEPAPEPAIAGPPDDGIRLPDMLTLPGENEFRKPASSGSQGSGSGAVIARPPSE